MREKNQEIVKEQILDGKSKNNSQHFPVLRKGIGIIIPIGIIILVMLFLPTKLTMDKQLIRLNKNTLKFSQINSFIRDYFSWKNFDLESVKKNPERTQNLEKFVHLLDTEYFSTISNLKKGDGCLSIQEHNALDTRLIKQYGRGANFLGSYFINKECYLRVELPQENIRHDMSQTECHITREAWILKDDMIAQRYYYRLSTDYEFLLIMPFSSIPLKCMQYITERTLFSYGTITYLKGERK